MGGGGEVAARPDLPAWRAALSPSTSWWPAWLGGKKKAPPLPDDAISARQRLLYRELVVSQNKCAKLEARKIAAMKAKDAYDKAQAK